MEPETRETVLALGRLEGIVQGMATALTKLSTDNTSWQSAHQLEDREAFLRMESLIKEGSGDNRRTNEAAISKLEADMQYQADRIEDLKTAHDVAVGDAQQRARHELWFRWLISVALGSVGAALVAHWLSP